MTLTRKIFNEIFHGIRQLLVAKYHFSKYPSADICTNNKAKTLEIFFSKLTAITTEYRKQSKLM